MLKDRSTDGTAIWALLLLAVAGGLWFISVVGYSCLWSTLNEGYSAIVLRDALLRVAVNEGEACFDEFDEECNARVAQKKKEKDDAANKEEFEEFADDEWL